MKYLFSALILISSLNSYALDLKDLKKEYSKAKARGPASMLGLKEGKIKKIGDQHFIQYKGEVYNLVTIDPDKVQELAEQYQKMQKKK